MNTIALPGCTPEPLINYLKALGVLSIVADRDNGLDPQARGCWQENAFQLETSLELPEMLDFIATRFCPSPILSPWLGGGGFLSDSGTTNDLIDRLVANDSERLATIREGVRGIENLSTLKTFAELREEDKALKKISSPSDQEKARHKVVAKEMKQLKEEIIFHLRNEMPDNALPWLDTCLTGNENGIRNAPHMGTGGNIGKLDISTNYLKNLELVLRNPERSLSWLRMALTGTNEQSLEGNSVSQFAPGQAGGANATQGTEGDSAINPWDFVLMIEGSLFLAGSLSKKLGSSSAPNASFPFTVRNSSIGASPMALGDDKKSKGELWLPLWHRPCSLAECRQLFAEGRAELAGKQAASGLDFARSIAGLGTDRGITSFVRYFFVEYVRAGVMAIPVGRFAVVERPQAVLLSDIDRWLSIYRRACGEKASARFQSSLREIESRIFEFCQFGDSGGSEGKRRFQRILIALGKAERLVALAPRFRENAIGLHPLGMLRSDWIAAADDRSPEFRIALALASIHHSSIGSLRNNLENVDALGGQKSGANHPNRYSWSEKNRSAVWGGGNLCTNLQHVLVRRVMDGSRNPDEQNTDHPLRSTHQVPLEHIAKFVDGRLDDDRIADLLWGLSLCRTDAYRPHRPRRESSSISNSSNDENENPDFAPLPPAYCLLKILFHDSIPRSDGDRQAPPQLTADPTILSQLRAGRLPEACQRAYRRLRALGHLPRPHAMRGYPTRDNEWLNIGGWNTKPERIAAALLIPIDIESARQLRWRMLRPADSIEQPYSPEQTSFSTPPN